MSEEVSGTWRQAVLLPDGTNVNRTLLKDGWCWWYRKYAPGDTVLEGLERKAREGRKGLLADAASAALGVAKDSKEAIAHSDAAEGDILITPR